MPIHATGWLPPGPGVSGLDFGQTSEDNSVPARSTTVAKKPERLPASPCGARARLWLYSQPHPPRGSQRPSEIGPATREMHRCKSTNVLQYLACSPQL